MDEVGSDAGRARSATATSQEAATAPDRAAPPLRLFVLPLIIVLILVALWIKIRLPSYQDIDPRELARGISKLDRSSWLKAYALSRMLAEKNNANLRTDRTLCRQLCTALDAELRRAVPDAEHIRLRVFLCRAIGEFELEAGLATLVRAASDRADCTVDVRYAALESLAVRAGHLGNTIVRSHPGVLESVIRASHAAHMTTPPQRAAELRSTAAYTLGVLGGASARDRLAEMLDDAYPNARFNAATGLARSGDERAVPVLLEMLNPANTAIVEGETSAAAQQQKRELVIVNAIRAATRLAAQNRTFDPAPLRQAVARIAESHELGNHVRGAARAALVQLDNPHPAAGQ